MHGGRGGLAVVVTALCVLISACGGGEDTSPASPGTSDGPPASGSPRLSEQLRKLGEDWAKVSARVTYDFSSRTKLAGSADAKMTFYSMPPGRTRFDVSGGSEGDSVLIQDNGKVYLCSTIAGHSGCIAGRSNSGVGTALPFFEGFGDPDTIQRNFEAADQFINLQQFDDEIAGQKANCFKATGAFYAEQNGEARWCFAPNGTLLRAQFIGPEAGEHHLDGTDAGEVTTSDVSPQDPQVDNRSLALQPP